MHSITPNPLYHGDVKGVSPSSSNRRPVLLSLFQCNVLISENGRALLTDFGLSFLANSSFSLSTVKKGGSSLPWMAPEMLDSAKPSAAGDVWSFAMTALVSFDHVYCKVN